MIQAQSGYRVLGVEVREEIAALPESVRLEPFRSLIGLPYEERPWRAALRGLLHRYGEMGYRARLTAEGIVRADSTLWIRVFVDPGPPLRVSSIHWEGVSSEQGAALQRAVDSLIGQVFTRSWRLRLLGLLRAKGYDGQPRVRLISTPDGLQIRIRPRSPSRGSAEGFLGWGSVHGWFGKLRLELDPSGQQTQRLQLRLERLPGLRFRSEARYERARLFGSGFALHLEGHLVQQDSAWRQLVLDGGVGYAQGLAEAGFRFRWANLLERIPSGVQGRSGIWAGGWVAWRGEGRMDMRLRALVGRWRQPGYALGQLRRQLEVYAQFALLRSGSWFLWLPVSAAGVWGSELHPAERLVLGGRDLPGYPEEAFRAERYLWARLELQRRMGLEAYVLGLAQGTLMREGSSDPARALLSWGVGMLYPTAAGVVEILYGAPADQRPGRGLLHVGYRLRW